MKAILLAGIVLFAISTNVSAAECFAAKSPEHERAYGNGNYMHYSIPSTLHGHFFHGRKLIDTGSSHKDAVHIARARGGCVEKYAFIIQQYDPKTGEVIKWKKEKGYSVWK